MSDAPAVVVRAAEAFGLDAGLLRGLGGNSGSAWEVAGQVLRVGRRTVIDAEVTASAAAASAVPVPRVLDRAELGACSALLLERLPGRPAAELARRNPALAQAAGRACGQVHNALAQVPAPPGLRPVAGNWASRLPAGPARVLHMDLHPFNVLVADDGAVTGVLDWANAAAGDTVLDRARSWAILTLDPAACARLAEPGWTQLTHGWTEAADLAGVPAAARAWACQFLLTDLASRYPPEALRHAATALKLAAGPHQQE